MRSALKLNRTFCSTRSLQRLRLIISQLSNSFPFYKLSLFVNLLGLVCNTFPVSGSICYPVHPIFLSYPFVVFLRFHLIALSGKLNSDTKNPCSAFIWCCFWSGQKGLSNVRKRSGTRYDRIKSVINLKTFTFYSLFKTYLNKMAGELISLYTIQLGNGSTIFQEKIIPSELANEFYFGKKIKESK